jgi:hypothetical protein
MDAVSFMFGFADELEKHAAKAAKAEKPGKAKRAYRAARGAAGKGAKEMARAGWAATKGVAPYALLAGIPLYFGAKAVSEGFGRGVSEEARKQLPYER